MKRFTLAFDVFGTLIDTSGVFGALAPLVGDQALPFMELWRGKQLEYTFRRGLMNKYVDFSICTRQALDYCCLHFLRPLSDLQKGALMDEYSKLPAFPEVQQSLKVLQGDRHRLFAFSNGSARMVSTLMRNANLDGLFHGVVSVENVSMFKPSPLVYQHFNDVAKSEKTDTWMVSGNAFDVIGAMDYGMRAIWVKRSPKMVFDPWGMEPTATVSHIGELKEVLDKAFNE